MQGFKSNQNVIYYKEIFNKSNWCSVMIHGRNFLSLFARTLEKILYRTLHKLIGLYSNTNLGLFYFGDKSDKGMIWWLWQST